MQQDAFDHLKQILSTPPILGYPDYSLPFELHTDASQKGLGAVLYQLQDGKKRVISYASGGLTKTERNYPAHKLEFLALKWSITEKFNDYLYGHDFTVITDNNPLTYILTSAKLDATGHRWLAALSVYNFDIQYRSGSGNMDADALSRLPGLHECQKIPLDSFKAVCNAMDVTSYVETLSFSTTVLGQANKDQLPGQDLYRLSDRDWRYAQANGEVLSTWIKAVKNKRLPTKHEQQDYLGSYNTLRKNFDRLVIERGILSRITKSSDKSTKKQLVVQSEFTQQILLELHNKVGHPGKDRTLSLLKDRFYWPNMQHDVEEWLRQCIRCVYHKSPTNVRAPLVSITTTRPLELVCMDF